MWKNSLIFIIFIFILTSCSNKNNENENIILKNSIEKKENSIESNILIIDKKQDINWKTIKISDKCTWCWRCIIADREHFKINLKNFKTDVVYNKNLDSQQLQNAIKTCPVNAISIS